MRLRWRRTNPCRIHSYLFLALARWSFQRKILIELEFCVIYLMCSFGIGLFCHIFLSITLCLRVFFRNFNLQITDGAFRSPNITPLLLLVHYSTLLASTLLHTSCWMIIELLAGWLSNWIATFLRIHQMNNTLAIERMRTKCVFKCFWCGQYTLHSMHSIYAQITSIYLLHLPGLQHQLSKLLDWYSRLKWLYLHINVWNKWISISHTLKATNEKKK